jgi:hypothetical protein
LSHQNESRKPTGKSVPIRAVTDRVPGRRDWSIFPL